jgi:hypothetical protein
MSFCFTSIFQHDDGFEEEVCRADLVKRENQAQAFAASFPAKMIGFVFGAIAPPACRFADLKTELASFQRKRPAGDPIGKGR